jgi:cytochrome d ubiquinol oxidase subunit I
VVSAGNGLFTMIGFMGLYTLLGLLFAVLVYREISKGPVAVAVQPAMAVAD